MKESFTTAFIKLTLFMYFLQSQQNTCLDFAYSLVTVCLWVSILVRMFHRYFFSLSSCCCQNFYFVHRSNILWVVRQVFWPFHNTCIAFVLFHCILKGNTTGQLRLLSATTWTELSNIVKCTSISQEPWVFALFYPPIYLSLVKILQMGNQ